MRNPYDDAAHAATSATPASHDPALLEGPVTFGLTSRTSDQPWLAHDLDQHLGSYGPRPDATGDAGGELLGALDVLGLTGRGGGHVEVARKWHSARRAGPGGIVVANCAEGEPASAKDAALVQLRPHLVLDGLELAAESIHASEATVWLHDGDLEGRQAMRVALSERRNGAIDALPIRIATGPDHYLTGESSAIVRGLSGGPVLPTLARRHAAVAGVGGRPTLIHNAETLARVALIARAGIDLPQDGALVTVVGPDRRAVLVAGEHETFASLLMRSSVLPKPPGAVLVGGYGGTWLPWSRIADVEANHVALQRIDASLGAGVVAALDPGACGLAETARILGYLAAASARQCGPCLFGLAAMAGLFERLAHGRSDRGDVTTLERYSAEVSGRGACRHPDGAVQLSRSALRTFAADARQHLSSGPCGAAGSAPVLPVPGVS
jgi:NADH:ubiquinone oxidoreductase subunit F (NADH-binding)